jgi:hypothetical protein
MIGSTTSSQCSTPNDRSLARALFDINSMFLNISLGRRVPVSLDSSLTTTPQHQPSFLRSTNHTFAQTTPPTIIPRTNSSSVSDESDFVNIPDTFRPSCSPARPNSLILTSASSYTSSQKKPLDSEDENENYYSAQSSRLSTPMIHSIDFSSSIRDFDEKTVLSSILDIDNDEQQLPHIQVVEPQNETDHSKL